VVEGYEIHAVRERADREAYARVALAVAPERARTVEENAYDERLSLGGVKLVARSAAEPVACGGAGPIQYYPPDFDGWWAELAVLVEHRGRGLGSELYVRLSLAAVEAGKRALHVLVSETSPDTIGWLERRGFREWERTRRLELDLATSTVQGSDCAEGLEIVALAQRPELLRAVYDVARETVADMPGTDEAHRAGSYDEWVARSVAPPGVREDAFFLALVDGRVAGYASLEISGAHPEIAWHDMTAVARAHRGRGIASALKRASIAWARQAGLERLQTENNIENAAMRAVNVRLGYRSLPDDIVLRGPLALRAGPVVIDICR
jgi:mycothiol synthase